MNPTEELYPGSDFETDITDQETNETSADDTQVNDDTFGEQIVPDETDTEDDSESESESESDQIGTETPLDQLRDEQTF